MIDDLRDELMASVDRKDYAARAQAFIKDELRPRNLVGLIDPCLASTMVLAEMTGLATRSYHAVVLDRMTP